jgi:hypothetical protein
MAIIVFGIVAAVCVCLLLAAWLYACVRERRALRRAMTRESAANRAAGDAEDPTRMGNQRAVFVDGVYLYSIPGNAGGEQRAPPGGVAGAGVWGPTRIPASLVLARLDKTSPPAPLTSCPSCEAESPAAAAALATVPNESQREGKGLCGADGVYCQCCSICLDPFMKGDMSRKLSCGHLFHSHCISKWVQRANRCPLCQHEIVRLEEVVQDLRQTQGGSGSSTGTAQDADTGTTAAPGSARTQPPSDSSISGTARSTARENRPVPRPRNAQQYPLLGSLGSGFFFA